MKFFLYLSFLFLTLFSQKSQSENSYQIRFDVGINLYKTRLFEDLSAALPEYNSTTSNQYLGIAVYKPISSTRAIGTRIDIQEINQYTLLSVRAIDYQFIMSESLTINSFLGAARYQFRTPAYGYVTGLGLLYRPNHWGPWGLQLEARYFDTLARDKLTAEDLKTPTYGPDSFHDIQSVTFGINYYF